MWDNRRRKVAYLILGRLGQCVFIKTQMVE